MKFPIDAPKAKALRALQALGFEIARADHSTFAVEFYLARAFEGEIKFLRDFVIVALRPASCGDTRFREALVLDGRIRAIEDRMNSRAVFRGKRGLG
jgi:hypothetical protein